MKPPRILSVLVLGLAMLALAPPAARAQAQHWITSITTEPSPPCPGADYTLVVRGVFPTSCGAVLGAEVVAPNFVRLRVQTPYPAAALCVPDSLPWEHRFPMPGLASGLQQVTVQMVVVDQTNPSWSGPVLNWVQIIPVPDSCEPQLNPIDFIAGLSIRGLGPDGRPRLPICPGDSIVVEAHGWVPSACWVLRKIDLLPSPIASPLPEPPVVRFVFDDRACLDIACTQVPERWNARAVLPPLPPRRYQLMVEAAIVSCRDSVVPGDPLAARSYPFGVTSADSCGLPPPACLLPRWERGGPDGCDAVLGPDHRTSVTMKIATPAPLAGLEGVLHVTPPAGLRIVGLVPVGPAAGMKLHATPTPDGMRFVMFALDGPPIPPSPNRDGWPVLRVLLEEPPILPTADPVYPLPERWIVTVDDVLGADTSGAAVPPCPIVTIDPAPGFVVEGARVCRGSGCDHNHDGREDVRDLVRMIRCLRGYPPCDTGAVPGMDCEHDGDFDVQDVVCCALAMLRAHPCPGCPADSARPAPRVALVLGEPEATGSGVKVRVRVQGSGELGAARFAVRFAGGDWRVRAVDAGSVPAGWLALDAPADGRHAIALLRIDETLTLGVDEPIDLVLDLEPGAGGGGAELQLVEAEFSGVDGVRLAVNDAQPAMPIGDPRALALSPASPNPFDGSTTFRLALGTRSAVRVGVYDLAGRRVATLHDGVLAAGVHPFTWDGRRDGGGRAPGGVYFYRAERGGKVTARKMVMLGTR